MRDHVPGYRPDRLIGRGGDAEVWLGWTDDAVPRPVALKQLVAGAGPGAALALRREAEVLAEIDHPNLLPVLAVVDGPSGTTLVLPYVGGGSLRGLLDERGTLDAGAVVAVLEPVALALEALHARGVVHGDVKPDNILLADDGEPVLADAGVAVAIGPRARGVGVAGTPAYLDPAAVAGGSVTSSADLFALAVTAYELLTGRAPHRGEPAEVVAAAGDRVHRPLGSWPGIAAAVGAAVEQGLDPDPSARPVGPAALVAALRDAVPAATVRLPGPCGPDHHRAARPADLGHRTIRFGPAPPARLAAGARSRHHRLRPVAVVAAVAVAIGGAAALAGPRRSHRSPARADEPSGSHSTRAAPCATTARADGPGQLRVDADGDGCAEPARWDGGVLVVGLASGPRSYRLGRPGDQVLAADWDGDGTVTVALYRRTEGQVLYVDRFPDRVGDRVAASSVRAAPPGGRARVATDGAGRPVVRVDPPA